LCNTTTLERPASELASVCRLLVARATNLQRLVDLHGLDASVEEHFARAVDSLDQAAEALTLVGDSTQEEEGGTKDGDEGSARSKEETRTDGLAGNSLVIPVTDALTFLSNMRSSGVMWIDTLEESFQVELEAGEAVYAATDNPPPGQRLGEILIAQGALTEERLEQELEAGREAGEILGASLLRREVIDREQLRRALFDQMQSIFQRLFAAEIATYHFAAGMRLVSEVDLRCNVTSLLLESAKKADEVRRLV
jgi:hypothetical protein